MLKISLNKAETLTRTILSSYGYSDTEVDQITKVILYGAMTGSSQGLSKLLGWHVEKHPQAQEPVLTKTSNVTYRCDAMMSNGMYANTIVIDSLISLAKQQGVGVVGVYNYRSSCGALGYYTRQVSKKGLVGLMFASADPSIVPPGGISPVLGTNPLSISIPHNKGDVTLDMSTAKYTWSDLVEANLNKSKLDEAFAFDQEGRSTDSAKLAMDGGVASFDGGYKGFNLALMIQIIAGALVGSAYKPSDSECDYGSIIVALDPQKLAGKVFINEQIQALTNAVRVSSSGFVLPGTRSNKRINQALTTSTVSVSLNTYNQLLKLTKKHTDKNS